MRENRRGSQSGRIFPRPKARVGPPVIYTPPEFGISYRLFYFLLRRFVFPDFSSQPSGYFSWSCKLSSSWPPFFLPTLLFLSLPFPCAHLPLCTACRAHVPERQVCSQLFATRWISTRKRSNFKRRRARSREYDFPLFALLSHHPSFNDQSHGMEWNSRPKKRNKNSSHFPLPRERNNDIIFYQRVKGKRKEEKKGRKHRWLVRSIREKIAAHVS